MTINWFLPTFYLFISERTGFGLVFHCSIPYAYTFITNGRHHTSARWDVSIYCRIKRNNIWAGDSPERPRAPFPVLTLVDRSNTVGFARQLPHVASVDAGHAHAFAWEAAHAMASNYCTLGLAPEERLPLLEGRGSSKPRITSAMSIPACLDTITHKRWPK